MMIQHRIQSVFVCTLVTLLATSWILFKCFLRPKIGQTRACKKKIFSIFYKIVKNSLRFPKRRSRLFLVGKTRLNLQGRPEKDLARNVIFREVTNTEKKSRNWELITWLLLGASKAVEILWILKDLTFITGFPLTKRRLLLPQPPQQQPLEVPQVQLLAHLHQQPPQLDHQLLHHHQQPPLQEPPQLHRNNLIKLKVEETLVSRIWT